MRRILARCAVFALLALMMPAVFAAQTPATATSATPQRKLVRVLVFENSPFYRVTVKGSYLIRALPSLQVLKQGNSLPGLPLTATPRGLKLGAEEWPVKGISIEPADDRDLYVSQKRYRGSMDFVLNPSRTIDAVNRVEMESYLYGVLHHEVSSWWPMEALKAQAIAARTYALYQRSVSRAALYDLKSTTSSQVYGGSGTERHRTNSAVDQTAGQVLTYQGKVFPTYFHATCAGMTAAAKELWDIDLPPLKGGVECGYCRISPHYGWHAEIPLSSIEEHMKRVARPVGQILNIELISQTPSHRVGRLRITGASGEAEIAAKDFRVWVGGDKMRSTNFTCRIQDDMALFDGKGWGHGVGLCQWGTFGQSLFGRGHEEILQFYYPGSVITNYRDQKVDA